MIGSSIWDYIFIRTCIVLLDLVAPLSTLYSLARLLVRLPIRLPGILEVWVVLEAAFYFVVYLPRRAYLQRAAIPATITCRDDRRMLFRRCHDNIPDWDRYLAKWFLDAPVAEIRRENVKDFLRWAFLGATEPSLTDDEELGEYVREIERLVGRQLAPGRGKAKCLRLTHDKVEMLHRSLTWYFVSICPKTKARKRIAKESN